MLLKKGVISFELFPPFKGPGRAYMGPYGPNKFQIIVNCTSLFSDCSLRQGASGTEFARFGSRTCFLRWFYNRSQVYFGQKSEEHIKTIKKRCLEIKKQRFLMKMRYMRKRNVFSALLPLFKGPGRSHMGPYGPEKFPKIHNKFAFIGAFTGPCTLP